MRSAQTRAPSAVTGRALALPDPRTRGGSPPHSVRTHAHTLQPPAVSNIIVTRIKKKKKMHVRVSVCLRACVRGRATARQERQSGEIQTQTHRDGAGWSGVGGGLVLGLHPRLIFLPGGLGGCERLSLCALRGRWGPRVPPARSSSCAHHARPHLTRLVRSQPPALPSPLPPAPEPSLEAAQPEGARIQGRGTPRS